VAQRSDPFATIAGHPNLPEEAAQALLDHAVAAEDTRGLRGAVERTLVAGRPAGAILEAAESADLVVVGSRGRGGLPASCWVRSVCKWPTMLSAPWWWSDWRLRDNRGASHRRPEAHPSSRSNGAAARRRRA
jgi:hypothetical protein